MLTFQLNAPVVMETQAKVFSDKLVSGNLPLNHRFSKYKGNGKQLSYLSVQGDSRFYGVATSEMGNF